MTIVETLGGRSSSKICNGPIFRNGPRSSGNILLQLADTLYTFVETQEVSEENLPGPAESCGTRGRATRWIMHVDTLDEAIRAKHPIYIIGHG